MSNNYNKNYDFTYHTDDEEFDVEHMNENFSAAADEFDTVYNKIDSKANTNHSHNLASTNVTGVLPVSKGGTGKYTLTSGQVLIGNGTGAITTRAIAMTPNSGSTSLITSGGVYNALSGKAESNHSHILSEDTVSGILPVSKGGTGADNIVQAKKNLGISKYCYVVAAYDSDSNLKNCADFIVEEESDFQYIIDSVPSGSVLRFLSGNYYLYSSSLKIDKQLILEGSGHQTVIYANGLNNQPVFKLGTDDVEKPTSNITIKDIYISHRDTGYDSARNLIEAGNINGLYIYRVGLNFNITNKVMSGSSIIKGSGYMRNVHIHDCVINSNIPDNSKERYCFNFKGIDASKKSEFCAYISNTSYLNNTEFSVNLLDADMKNKIALTGILGGYKLYVNKQEVAQ